MQRPSCHENRHSDQCVTETSHTSTPQDTAYDGHLMQPCRGLVHSQGLSIPARYIVSQYEWCAYVISSVIRQGCKDQIFYILDNRFIINSRFRFVEYE